MPVSFISCYMTTRAKVTWPFSFILISLQWLRTIKGKYKKAFGQASELIMKNNKSRTGTGQYIPNFDDPRIRKRVEKALGWSLGCVRGEPREMAKGWIGLPP